jgi:histidinol-phosphate aminotransferase
MTQRMHGGTDALGIARFDFSTNSNACGPCPSAWASVKEADVSHYPDPSYVDLRLQLAKFHGVELSRILIASSASEFIQRVTAWSKLKGGKYFWTPQHAYVDYAHAAHVWGMLKVDHFEQANLVWLCDPSTPLGQTVAEGELHRVISKSSFTTVIDCAYRPLRLEGKYLHESNVLDQVWQLWSPNKALGMTGVRGAYVVAPLGSQSSVLELEALSASWPLGVHGQAMLLAWTLEETQAWVKDTRKVLKEWKTALVSSLEQKGWSCLSSQSHYFCAKPPVKILASDLRRFDIKLRDASSFGFSGLWRLSAQKPEALCALELALRSIQPEVKIT